MWVGVHSVRSAQLDLPADKLILFLRLLEPETNRLSADRAKMRIDTGLVTLTVVGENHGSEKTENAD